MILTGRKEHKIRGVTSVDLRPLLSAPTCHAEQFAALLKRLYFLINCDDARLFAMNSAWRPFFHHGQLPMLDPIIVIRVIRVNQREVLPFPWNVANSF